MGSLAGSQAAAEPDALQVGLTAHLGDPLGRAAALDEAKKWLRTLPRKDVEGLVASLTHGEIRGTVGPAPTKKLAMLVRACPLYRVRLKFPTVFVHPKISSTRLRMRWLTA